MRKLIFMILLAILVMMPGIQAMCDFVPASESGPPPQAAIDAARVFADGEEIKFIGINYYGTKQTAWLSVWRFGTDHRSIDVDIATNEVNTVGPLGGTEPSNAILNIDEALEKVLANFAVHQVDINNLNMEERKSRPNLQTPTRIYNEYAFKWYGRTPEGIRLPRWVDIDIEDNGQLGIFNRIDRTVEISLEPRISADAAIQKAIELSGYSNKAVVTGVDLFVGWTPPKRQCLMWAIGLSDSSHEYQAMYIIDAHNGEHISGGQFDGGPRTNEPPTPELLAKAKQVIDDLSKTEKIEILSSGKNDGKYTGFYDPHADGVKANTVLAAKKKSKAFEAIKTAVSSMLKSPIDFSPLMGPSIWMKIYMPGDKDVYYCRYTTGNFGICWKENLADRDKDPKAYDFARRIKGAGMINVGVRVDAKFTKLISKASGNK